MRILETTNTKNYQQILPLFRPFALHLHDFEECFLCRNEPLHKFDHEMDHCLYASDNKKREDFLLIRMCEYVQTVRHPQRHLDIICYYQMNSFQLVTAQEKSQQ